MTRKRRMTDASELAEHESGLRSLLAQSEGEQYISHESLADAKSDPNGVAIFEGDNGGQIYAVARVAFVTCAETQLHRLLLELDALSWADPDSARIYFESVAIGSGVPGGMGGGAVAPELWVHPNLTKYEGAIRNVLLGLQGSIHQ